MARVGRLAGAILAQSNGEFWLVGDLKEPCDFPAAGFETPAQIPGRELPFVRLSPLRETQVTGPLLLVPGEGEELAALLHRRFIIARNGSVANRLWRLASGGAEEGEVDCRWLAEMPDAVWEAVRETVLKCS